jgi:hypothetical protein
LGTAFFTFALVVFLTGKVLFIGLVIFLEGINFDAVFFAGAAFFATAFFAEVFCGTAFLAVLVFLAGTFFF